MNVCIIDGNYQYTKLFADLGFNITPFDINEFHKDANLVVFTGGEDVSPEFYGDSKHATTYSNLFRDEIEYEAFNLCIDHDIPMVGICRGAQFLNVCNGGRMYQDVDKHAVADGHNITDLETGEVIYVSSTHHQMMMPTDKAIIIATSNLGGYREWFDGTHAKRDISSQDFEVVFYPKANALCFQPHPEFNSPEYEGMKNYFKGLLSKCLSIHTEEV